MTEQTPSPAWHAQLRARGYRLTPQRQMVLEAVAILGHGAPTYHPADDADHLHLVCRVCGGIEEVAPAVLDSAAQQIAAEHGFRVDASHFAIFGTCAGCAPV